jgi:1-deoxy-D-xylulose-5-phosphate reductoisomerase
VLNAANEVAVEAFCRGGLRFDQIAAVVAMAMQTHQVITWPSLEQILGADAWTRSLLRSQLGTPEALARFLGAG